MNKQQKRRSTYNNVSLTQVKVVSKQASQAASCAAKPGRSSLKSSAPAHQQRRRLRRHAIDVRAQLSNGGAKSVQTVAPPIAPGFFSFPM